MDKIKWLYRFLRRYFIDYKNSKDYQIKFFNYSFGNFNNYMDKIPYEEHWLYQFILKHEYLKNKDFSIGIFSVHGDRPVIYLNRSKYKIFYTLENVHVKDTHWNKYEDLLLNDKQINLSIGFDYLQHEKYIRLPLWIMTVFDPNETYESIKRKCELINSSSKKVKKEKFCALICRNDYFGDRKYFLDLIENIETVNCPGPFMHNDDDLLNFYNDNKREYLKNFQFNLCPENTNFEGYVTEKIFDSILSGCIPIYWGSNNNPEPKILNKKRILFLELNGDNTETINLIKKMWNDDEQYQEFISQSILLPNAPDEIYSYFKRLDNYLYNMLK